MFGLIKVPFWHLPLPLSGQCVAYLCASTDGLCVPWEGLCVYVLCKAVCTVLFFSLPWLDPLVLYKEAETVWSTSFILHRFSLLLSVTAQQINSLLILISQEITYLLFLTALLSRSHTQSKLAFFLTLLFSFCLSAHMHAHIHAIHWWPDEGAATYIQETHYTLSHTD